MARRVMFVWTGILLCDCKLVRDSAWDEALDGPCVCTPQQRLTGEVRAEDQVAVIDQQDASHFGVSAVGLGDLDGDGADFAVGAPLRTAAADGASAADNGENGGVYLFEGGEGWDAGADAQPLDLDDTLTATTRALTGAFNAEAGWSLAAGDFTGSGEVSLVIAAPSTDPPDSGKAQYWLVSGLSDQGQFGGASGRELDERVDIVLGSVGFDQDSFLGVAGTVAGLNTDGSDALVLANAMPVFVTHDEIEGWVCVLTGAVTDSVQLTDVCDPLSLPAGDAHARTFGTRLLGADLVGSDVPDLVVAAPGWDDSASAWVSGSVYLLNGEDLRDGNATMDDALSWACPGSGCVADGLGNALAAGDLDGDGEPDLALGAPGQDSVWVVLGTDLRTQDAGEAPWDDAVQIEEPTSDLVDFGAALAVPGDVDCDGYADLAVGAPRAPTGAWGAGGEVFLIHGAKELDLRPTLTSDRVAVLEPDEGSDLPPYLGGNLTAVGDVTGDGVPDLLVGIGVKPYEGNSGILLWAL